MNCSSAYPLYRTEEKSSFRPFRPKGPTTKTPSYEFLGIPSQIHSSTSVNDFQKLSNCLLLNSVALSAKDFTPSRNKRLSDFKKLLAELPLKKVRFTYLTQDPAYFFRLELKGEIEITITQYDEDVLQDAYVNVMQAKEVVFQNRLEFADIISAMKLFYSSYPDGK